MTKQADLGGLNSKLDEEIDKVVQLEKTFLTWANQQREKFKECRERKLGEGDMKVSEFNQIVASLNTIDSVNDQTKAYLIETFRLLTP